MRVIWLALLLIAIGCRSGPQTTAGSPNRAISTSAKQISSTEEDTAAHAEIVPAAFSAEPERDISGDGGGPLLPGQRRPTTQDDTALQIESVVSAMPVSMTLETAIQTALERNPDLVAVRSSEPVAHAAYHVANTYPFNPQFQTQVLPYTRDRDGNDAPVSQQHVIVQTFELAGQRRFRSGAAAANWEQVRQTIQQAERLTVAQAERLYFAALYQRELREINQLLATLNEKMVGVMERRLKAGQANSADVALARLQAQSTRRQQRLLEANYQTALMSLRNYLNFEEETELELNDHWLGWKWNSLADVSQETNHKLLDGQTPGLQTDLDGPAWELSVRQMAAERPDVAAARAAAAMARENLALAEAMRTPNLQIGPMWQRDDSATQFWGVQAQMNIPVVNTGTPLVDQRRAELQQQQVMAGRLEEKAVLEARAAIRRYERARRLVEQSRGEFAYSMSDTLKPFEDQFRAGQIGLLQVIAARTSFVQSRQSFLDLLNELSLAAADVTRTTGLPARQLILEPQSTLDDTTTVPQP